MHLLGNYVIAACTEAFKLIDMTIQEGIHPCLGAVELVPIYPLLDVDVEECGKVAQSKWKFRDNILLRGLKKSENDIIP